jgi:DNA mismatch endonuclease, patch repair protein
MADTFTKEKRSEVMSRIRGKDTKPEKTVRSYLHRLGFRFSLHSPQLPGKPDIILKKYKTIVFVHGCFWHQCSYCKGGRLPKSNIIFWKKKLKKTQQRDRAYIEKLREMKWNVIVVWECQIKSGEFKKMLKPLTDKKTKHNL